MWGRLTAFVKDLVAAEPEITEDPKKATKPIDPARRLTDLERSVELWTVGVTLEWLQLKGVHSEQIAQLVERLWIDGDGLLALAAPDCDVIKDEAVLELMRKLKHEYEAGGREYMEVLPGIVAKEMQRWPPHEIPTFERTENKEASLLSGIRLVQFYHDATKNTATKGARSLNRDWMNQPRCYRRYWGAPFIPLSLPVETASSKGITLNAHRQGNASFDPPLYNSLYEPQPDTSATVDIWATISRLLFYSLGMSSRKDGFALATNARSAWSKRVNPSSGGLHPEECYLILPPNDQLGCQTAALYHYSTREHALERRKEIDPQVWKAMTVGLPPNSFFVGVTVIPWREVWKYGERGFRYTHLDVGHVLGALRFGAAMVGGSFQTFSDFPEAALATLLGIDINTTEVPNDAEYPCAFGVMTFGSPDASYQFPLDIITSVSGSDSPWTGKPNTLSWDNTRWDIVEAVKHVLLDTHWSREESAVSLVAPNVAGQTKLQIAEGVLHTDTATASSATVVRQRRSALDFTLGYQLPKIRFLSILARLVPQLSPIPWDALPGSAEHIPFIGIYVLSVEGLQPGFYGLVRDLTMLGHLKKRTPNLLWQALEGAPAELPLFLLRVGTTEDKPSETKATETEQENESEKEKEPAAGPPENELRNVKSASKIAACHQGIAQSSSFTLGMFTPLQYILHTHGLPHYKQIHWHAGLIGHILYLEAEAMGLGGTGMGCFLDDVAQHDFDFSRPAEIDTTLAGAEMQDIYHFTIGAKTRDSRYPYWQYENEMFELVEL